MIYSGLKQQEIVEICSVHLFYFMAFQILLTLGLFLPNKKGRTAGFFAIVIFMGMSYASFVILSWSGS